MKAFPAVIKWFGSKRPVAEEIATQFPKCKCYFEPFVGGGALMPFAKSEKAVANDIIPELVDLWKNIKTQPAVVANEYNIRWQRLQKEGADVYYQIRDNFNHTKNCFDFLFLTRTCVNGMIRYNEKGEFNNSFHVSRPGINPETLSLIINKWSLAIQQFEFTNVDYRECLALAKKGDFVFLDPPYGGTKDRYTRIEFKLETFYEELERLNSIGVKWILTFDGQSGDRKYNFAPPKEVFKQHQLIKTGNSAFARLMDNKKNEVFESVYLNF